MSSEPSTPIPRQQVAFVTTQWTRVLSSRGDSPEAKSALSDLCGAYYAPVLAFVRRASRDDEAARDLTQEFFARILARQGVDTVERGKGRFRSFLLGAVKHFMADMRDKARTGKRGSGEIPVALPDGSDTSSGFDFPDQSVMSPDVEFDRKWALTILDRALAQLADENSGAGKSAHFEILKPWLMGDTEGLSQAEASKQLDMNEGAVKVAIHRLRRRFRELVKAEISQTLNDPNQVQDELNCLMAALSR